MWDFDPDEFFFLLFCAIATLALLIRYYARLFSISFMIGRPGIRLVLAAVPPIAMIVIYWVLQTSADPARVRDHEDYITLFMVSGAVWVLGAAEFLPILGISIRDDALERGNRAAVVVAVAAMLGSTCIYAGSNIGGGATIWMTIVPAMIATGAMVFLWFAIQLTTRLADTLTVDRDIRSALVMAGFVVAAGVDLGWAMSGDWEGTDAMVRDFLHRGWPSVGLAVVAIVLLRSLKPKWKPQP